MSTDPTAPSEQLLVTKTALGLQVQGQLRLLVAAVAGALITAAANRLELPLLNDLWGQNADQVVGAIVGGLMYVGMAGWQAARTWLTNKRWWRLAVDPDVPARLVAVHPSEFTKGA